MSLRAVTLGGRERIVLAAPFQIQPHDVAPDGRVLASTLDFRQRLFFRGDATSLEHEFSVQADTGLVAISPDRSWVAFSDDSINGVLQCYLRSASGAPPVSLGPGSPANFSADSRTLVVVQPEVPAVILHPVGRGQPTTIRLDGFKIGIFRAAGFLPDGKAIWFQGSQESRPRRIWEVASGGKPRPLTPEGVSGGVTEDGTAVISWRDSKNWIQPIAGGEARLLEGVLDGEFVSAWTADGRPLFVFRINECPAKVYRLDPKTGRREFFREVGPADCAGVTGVAPFLTRDGKACTYSFVQWLSELHVIEGLR